MYTRLYLKWITSKDLLHSTGNSAQCYMTGWMGGEFRGEWIRVYICMSESLCYASKTITTLLIGYLLILNKKLFFKKNTNISYGKEVLLIIFKFINMHFAGERSSSRSCLKNCSDMSL